MSKKGYCISFIVICLLLLTATIVYLLRIDPQSCKYAYRLQATVRYWRGISNHPILRPPYKFTGEWMDWYENGGKSKATYVNCELDGRIMNWDDNGNITRNSFFHRNRYLELRYEDGKDLAKGIYYNQKKWYGSFVTQLKDAFGPNIVVYYLDYKEVSKDEYEKWAKETGGVDRLLKEHPEVER